MDCHYNYTPVKQQQNKKPKAPFCGQHNQRLVSSEPLYTSQSKFHHGGSPKLAKWFPPQDLCTSCSTFAQPNCYLVGCFLSFTSEGSSLSTESDTGPSQHSSLCQITFLHSLQHPPCSSCGLIVGFLAECLSSC